jgi:hypothetical protein
LVLGAAGVLWWLVQVVRAGGLSPNDLLGNGLGLASLVVSIVALREQRRQAAAKGEDDSARRDRAADTLAENVRLYWETEAGLRAVDEHYRLQVRWVTTDRPVAVPIASVAGGAIPGRVARLRGHIDQLADRYLALPHRRLVVLGEPGAGKTVLAMLLTLELLQRREVGGPVAVLEGLAAWDPTAEHLHTWLARRLTEDYPALRHPSLGPDAALELVTSGRVLPVLDGLDELPEQLQAHAIGELERGWGGRPLIVTCRSQEFERAVKAGGQVLAAAAVVELMPVTAAEATKFLRGAAGPEPFVARWDRVVAHLQVHPRGGLARALSTPLMVALARTIYTLPDRDPGELVDLATAGSRAAVERQLVKGFIDPGELVVLATAGGRAAVEDRLLDGFIPAVYASTTSAPNTPAPRLRHPPSPESAGRWLGVLAGHLDQQGTRDLAWWQLRNLLPERTRGLLSRLLFGLGIGLAAGLAAGLEDGLKYGFAAGLLWGLVVALVFGFFFGFVFGVGYAIDVSPARVNARLRGRRVGDLLRSLGLGIGIGLLFGLLFFGSGLRLGLGVGLGVGLVGGLAAGLIIWLGSPGLDAAAVTPDSVLRGDRVLALARGLAAGLAGGLAAGLVGGGLMVRLLGGLGLGLVDWLVVALVVGLLPSAWGRFAVARDWLALRRQLPWRLMAFLDDAHRRGVLRQVGAVYQFRHARLQDHLAAASPAAAPDDPSRILHT